MSVSTRSDFVDFIYPLWERLELYDSTKLSSDQPKNDAADPTKAIPQGFLDAMSVREQVYVEEQGVPLENELDDDDKRSFHWTVYASVPSKNSTPLVQAVENGNQNGRRVSSSTKIPIGTIRLVPPPHAPHPSPNSHHKTDAVNGDVRKHSTSVHDGKEAYIKLGRLTVIPPYRKAGISKLLIETALAYARNHPYEVMPGWDPAKFESLKQDSDLMSRVDWKGLVLVHAQVGVQKVWRRYGFETDESMVSWDEEGIEHVGMWKKLDVSAGRRQSKIWLGGMGSPLLSPLASP
ncbi:hypothetical protein LTR56_004040 [Elasticomyces elasticus]|nr:hypothetical protein LTR56_004040 [Elasticomyces elasticus]KAK3661398.1 hypothetical protein LTR22_007605 [Elasticomyces elasticus]KAK4928906.1 hypothetical protein LTR49_004407 [Elasticomyces elasticus]KAK5765428.1 hypothetical protein LTS12_004441 [Elasticomyces elasticus]